MNDETQLERYLDEAVNAALVKGSFWAAMLGIVCSAVMSVGIFSGQVTGIEYPAIYALVCGCYAAAFNWSARRGTLQGRWRYPAFLPFVLLPTAFFVGAEVFIPDGGAAIYITGPISYLYFIMILITGFVFDRRLALLSGVLSGAGYLAVFFAVQDRLNAELSGLSPAFFQDFASPLFYSFKAVMMLVAGLMTGALTGFTRKLIVRILKEEDEKRMINKLFGEYVSDEIREKIIAEKAALTGENREVAVLFSDIRAFSTFSEGRSPEEVVTHLNEYFERMVAAVQSAGGVVDKFIGDAVMAVFGGVVELDNPAEAALDAAVAMREGLAQLNAEWTAAGRPTFDNGVGIHFGDVVQGPLGSPNRKEFTVIGDAVNTASRLEGLCKGHGRPIIVSEAVAERLPAAKRDRCEDLGAVQVKGKAEEIRIHGVSDA